MGTGTAVLGVTAAWLVTFYRFPGSRAWEWALLLPLTMPAYVIAYTYTGLLDFAGPVQSALREAFGWTREDYWLPPVRSLPGAAAMLTLVLYPYVYMLARASFLSQSVCAIEASRTLGYGPWRSFFSVTLPLARRAAEVRLGDVPDDVTEIASQCLLDWLAVTLAGSSEPAACLALAVALEDEPGDRGATVVGTSTRLSPPAAAIVNGL